MFLTLAGDVLAAFALVNLLYFAGVVTHLLLTNGGRRGFEDDE